MLPWSSVKLLNVLGPDPVGIGGEIRAFRILKTGRRLPVLQVCRIARITQAITKHNHGIKGLRLGSTSQAPERRQQSRSPATESPQPAIDQLLPV
ncbi:hypothetical protein [Candidatus Synechococcus spongiarum]|uniref:hypothetical protein n=1 Tax=Candidatus Synechococcus spongiarum TaxID=431041 RepID=UPI0011787BE6|nr:hypothetical protein [Candidatus Synechococcus spongiarum]